MSFSIIITGSIATGKSSVTSLLKLHGYRIIDADLVAHKVLEDLKIEVVKEFGEEILDAGFIDRKKLGKIIFSNEEKRKKLESILHPRIREEIKKEAMELELKERFFFIDIPLFFETNSYSEFEKVLVVYASQEEQLKRLIQRDSITKDEALQKIGSQLPIEEKVKKATWVINNIGDIKHLTNEVDSFVKNLESN